MSEPRWQQYETEKPEPGEMLVEMQCCGFRFSALHKDEGRDGYTCPLCAPAAPRREEAGG